MLVSERDQKATFKKRCAGPSHGEVSRGGTVGTLQMRAGEGPKVFWQVCRQAVASLIGQQSTFLMSENSIFNIFIHFL